MTDPKQVQMRREGDLAFPVVEKETPTLPPSEETTPVEVAPAPAKKFNEDPDIQDYIERQVAKRAEGIEVKLREELKGNTAAIREEIGKQRDKNAAETKIPTWFGGNQVQWDEYRGWLDGRLEQIEESAVGKTFERATAQATEAQKRVDDATEYFRGELAIITADKELNPSGKSIDPDKLLKVVLENDLVDSQGRWNYRAGLRFMNSHPNSSHAPKPGDKNLAAVTMDGTGSGKGIEQTPKNFKTAKDFSKKRPW